jgi:hypothetical protein
VPILVDAQVMESAGIVPEADMPAGAAGEEGKSGPTPEISSERLSIFEDFIDKLDLKKLDDKDKPDKPAPPGKPDDPGGEKKT